MVRIRIGIISQQGPKLAHHTDELYSHCAAWLLNSAKASDDHLQVPSWSGAVILGRCVHPGLVCRWQVVAAVGKQRDTRAAHKDHDRSEGLCRGWPGHLEQPPR